jgi:hypothetical protein
MFICKNLNIETKRSKLMLNCESSEAKRTFSIVEKIISKRSEHVYIEEFEYRSEANRFDSDFVFKKTKKSELSFFFNEGQKTKGFDSKLSKFCHCWKLHYLFLIHQRALLPSDNYTWISLQPHYCFLWLTLAF